MTLPALLALALALSIDNGAIAAAIGAADAQGRRTPAFVRVPLVFGVFSFAAALLGALLGLPAAHVFRGYGGVAAFIVLAFVAWQMLRAGPQPAGRSDFDTSWAALLLLGAATSADALAAGFGLALTGGNIVIAAGVIGGVTGCVSLGGVALGEPIGTTLGTKGKAVASLVMLVAGVHALMRSRP